MGCGAPDTDVDPKTNPFMSNLLGDRYGEGSCCSVTKFDRVHLADISSGVDDVAQFDDSHAIETLVDNSGDDAVHNVWSFCGSQEDSGQQGLKLTSAAP